jgi:hypothetical protein
MKILNLRYSRWVRMGLLSCALLGFTIESTYAMGWENDNGGGFAVSCGGGAYTVNYETFYFLGIAWSHREVWRNSNNQILGGNPCDEAPPE